MKLLSTLTLALSFSVLAPMMMPVAEAAPTSAKKVSKPKKAGARPQGFIDSIDTAMARAEKEKLPVMVLFTNPPTCPFCVKLEDEVFNNKKWKSGSKKKFIGLYLDNANSDPRKAEFQRKYPCQGIPTFFYIKPDGTIISKGGYSKSMGIDGYLKDLKTAYDAVKADAKAKKD